jgi:hypothetical protein
MMKIRGPNVDIKRKQQRLRGLGAHIIRIQLKSRKLKSQHLKKITKTKRLKFCKTYGEDDNDFISMQPTNSNSNLPCM